MLHSDSMRPKNSHYGTVSHFCGHYGLATPTTVPYYAIVFTVPGTIYTVPGIYAAPGSTGMLMRLYSTVKACLPRQYGRRSVAGRRHAGKAV